MFLKIIFNNYNSLDLPRLARAFKPLFLIPIYYTRLVDFGNARKTSVFNTLPKFTTGIYQGFFKASPVVELGNALKARPVGHC
jgi:hypothetical protein